MDGTASTLVNEAVLVEQALTDSTAFAPIYEYYFPRVYNYVRYRVRDAQTTDDLTALIFERVFLKLNDYHAEQAPFSAWLFAIARNAVGDYFRAQKRHRWLPLEILHEQIGNELPPETITQNHEEQIRLLQAVSGLEHRQRDLIALKFGAGLNNRQIADLTGLSESNVAVIVYRAIRQLRVVLSGEG